MTIDAAWDQFRCAIIAYREGWISWDEYCSAKAKFMFLFTGKTAGRA